jgi:hypothetical protein
MKPRAVAACLVLAIAPAIAWPSPNWTVVSGGAKTGVSILNDSASTYYYQGKHYIVAVFQFSHAETETVDVLRLAFATQDCQLQHGNLFRLVNESLWSVVTYTALGAGNVAGNVASALCRAK